MLYWRVQVVGKTGSVLLSDGGRTSGVPYVCGVSGEKAPASIAPQWQPLRKSLSTLTGGSVQVKPMELTIVLPPDGGDLVERVRDLQAVLGFGDPDIKPVKLIIQPVSTSPAVTYYGVFTDMEPLTKGGEAWTVKFQAISYGTADRHSVSWTARLTNMLVNPSFESFVINPSGSDQITGWTRSGNAGMTANISNIARYEGHSARLQNDTATALLRQSVSVQTNTQYCLSAWIHMPNTSTIPVIRINGLDQQLQVERRWTSPDGRLWTRYYVTWNSGSATSMNFDVGCRNGTAYVDAVQMETGSSPVPFNMDLGDRIVFYTSVNYTGTAVAPVRITVTPQTDPQGNWRHRIGPIEVKNQLDRGVRLPFMITLQNAGSPQIAGSLVQQGYLRPDGRDLRVVDEHNRPYRIWIANEGQNETDWKIWVYGPYFNANETRRFWILLNWPELNNRLDDMNPPVNIQPVTYSRSRPQGRLRAGRYYWIKMSSYSSLIDEESVASDPVMIYRRPDIDGDNTYSVLLGWTSSWLATHTYVYMATGPADGSEPANSDYRLVARVPNTRNRLWLDGNETGVSRRPRRGPNQAPALQASGSGSSLQAGAWSVAYTYVFSNGNESPRSPIGFIAVSSGQNIAVTLPARPAGVVRYNIYVSQARQSQILRYHGNTTGTTYTITSPPAGNAQRPPRIRSPYDVVRPAFDLATSTNAYWQWNSQTGLEDPDRRRYQPPGAWKPDKRDGRISRWPTGYGITTMQRKKAGPAADQYVFASPLRITRLQGQMSVQQNPNDYAVRAEGVAGDSAYELEDAANVPLLNDRLKRPGFKAIANYSAGSLPAGTYWITVTAATSGTAGLPGITGDLETDGYVLKVTLKKAGRIQVIIDEPRVTGAAVFGIYCSRKNVPGKYYLVRTVTGIGQSNPHYISDPNQINTNNPQPPDENQSLQIYGSLTPQAFDTGTMPNSVNDRIINGIRLWLDERRNRFGPQADSRAEFGLVASNDWLRITFHANDILLADTASASNITPTSHMIYRVENEQDDNWLSLDLFDAVTGEEILIDCEKQAVSRNIQGRGRMDQVDVSDHDRWLVLLPRCVQDFRHEIWKRSGSSPVLSIQFVWYDRYDAGVFVP